MCCIFLSISHPIYQFILISNRDEFLKRSTRSSQWHSFPTPTQILQSQQSPSSSPSSLSLSLSSSNRNRILSGIDSDTSGGGTWLGITSSGKFGALTNFTEIKPPPLPQDRGLENYRSRGGLVKDWLIEQIDEKKPDESKVEAKDYLEKVSNQSDEYPGFNLLIGELARNLEEEVKIGYLSNREEKVKNQKGDGRNDVTFPSAKRLDLNQGGRVYSVPSTDTKIENQINRDKMNQTRQIETGCESCGLSNSVLDDRWEKVNQGNLDFEKVLQDHLDIQGKGFEEDKMIEELFGILGTSTVETITSRQEMKSSILIPPFQISENWYATRTSTVLLVERPKPGTLTRDEEKIKARWIERDIFVLSGQGEPIRAEDDGRKGERRWEWELEG